MIPGQFRKRPVVIDAVQFNRENGDAIAAWCGGQFYFSVNHTPNLRIHTLEGDHFASVGDWIIRGVKGEFYPCKPDIFAATYEAVT
jgi:hypothetical protein